MSSGQKLGFFLTLDVERIIIGTKGLLKCLACSSNILSNGPTF